MPVEKGDDENITRNQKSKCYHGLGSHVYEATFFSRRVSKIGRKQQQQQQRYFFLSFLVSFHADFRKSGGDNNNSNNASEEQQKEETETEIQLQFAAGVFVQVTTGEPWEAGSMVAV